MQVEVQDTRTSHLHLVKLLSGAPHALIWTFGGASPDLGWKGEKDFSTYWPIFFFRAVDVLKKILCADYFFHPFIHCTCCFAPGLTTGCACTRRTFSRPSPDLLWLSSNSTLHLISISSDSSPDVLWALLWTSSSGSFLDLSWTSSDSPPELLFWTSSGSHQALLRLSSEISSGPPLDLLASVCVSNPSCHSGDGDLSFSWKASLFKVGSSQH